MKIKRTVALLILAVMALGMFASCGGGSSSSEITVSVVFYNDKDEAVVNLENKVKVSGENPTVIDAVRYVNDNFDFTIGLTSDEKNVKSFSSEDGTYNNGTCVWQYYVNKTDKAPKGDASDYVIKDGDKIIYKFESIAETTEETVAETN